MAQKAGDNHTSTTPRAPTVEAAETSARTITPLRRLVRLVAALPLHRFVPLSDAFAQVKSRVGSGELAAYDLWRHAREKRLTIAARVLIDGTERALVCRSAFWQYFNLSGKARVRESPPLLGTWWFYVGRRRFDRLYSTAAPSAAVADSMVAKPAVDHEPEPSTSARRGRKPYDFWELYKVKFYLMLYDDDVPAHADINVQRYADRLMAWGHNNFGEKKTPEQERMRTRIAEWKPLWQQLKSANK